MDPCGLINNKGKLYFQKRPQLQYILDSLETVQGPKHRYISDFFECHVSVTLDGKETFHVNKTASGSP